MGFALEAEVSRKTSNEKPSSKLGGRWDWLHCGETFSGRMRTNRPAVDHRMVKLDELCGRNARLIDRVHGITSFDVRFARAAALIGLQDADQVARPAAEPVRPSTSCCSERRLDDGEFLPSIGGRRPRIAGVTTGPAAGERIGLALRALGNGPTVRIACATATVEPGRRGP